MNSGPTSTMPNIPSAASVNLAGWGRGGDTMMAHVNPGEMLIPPEVQHANPELMHALARAMEGMGANPNQYIVGSPDMSINPHTGHPEFFFKAIKKLVKKIAKSSIGKIVLPAVAGAIGGPVAAAAVSGVTTKVSGGSWGQALGAAAGSYLGNSVGTKLFGSTTAGAISPTSFNVPVPTVTSGLLGSGGLGTWGSALGSVGTMLPSSIAGASISNAVGSIIGSNIGAGIGATIDPPKLASEYYNDGAVDLSTTVPTGTNTLAIPDANAAVSTDTGASKGSGVSSTGVSYLSPVINRNTGQSSLQPVNGAFSSNFGTQRRSSWGSFATV